MLGEISLEQWRCVAELIDNSIDGFLNEATEGTSPSQAEIVVSLPTTTSGNPVIKVRDNGPGMRADILEMAVRAGWTANEPVGNLGMFGMGFNISTARLGTRTRVWTTTAADNEWHGLEIDFQTLIQQRHYRTPRLSRPKQDPAEHGTEISIDRLKTEASQWFAKTGNRSRVERELSKVYSSMLRSNGVPLSFKLQVNGRSLLGRRHCAWGDDAIGRVVSTPRHGEINVIQTVDHNLGNRGYCLKCWTWLMANEEECPSCRESAHIRQRPRRVHGWLGIQRYLSENDYGIDFIRHGRKIELSSKDLFQWDNDGSMEREYPIDDPRNRGRIVGEIHLDHARVTYTKDRFDRNDPAWQDMVAAVRGEGPLRPDKANELGYLENRSPLFLLFQAFRRSNPQRRNMAGGFSRLLVVPDNDRATEMAQKFHAGESEYQEDRKWFELVEEADERNLTDSPDGEQEGETGNGDLEDFTGSDTSSSETTNNQQSPDALRQLMESQRIQVAALTREYVCELANIRWDIDAFQVNPDDPDLGGSSQPWKLLAPTQGRYRFFVNPRHPIFQSATMTALDGLLSELTWAAVDFLRGQSSVVSFGSVLAELRARYSNSTSLEPSTLAIEATSTVTELGRSLQRNVAEGEGVGYFRALPAADQAAIHSRMAARTVADPQMAISQGKFLEYAPPSVILRFFQQQPALFLDGKYWETPYLGLDYGNEAATEEARLQIIQYYTSLLVDAVWLTDQDPTSLGSANRDRLLRASLALGLLAPSVEVD